MRRIPYVIFLILAFLNLGNFSVYDKGQVLGYSTISDSDANPYKPGVKTVTRFEQKEIIETVPIPFETRYQKDKTLAYDTEKILQEGKNGSKISHFLVTRWREEEIDRQLKSVDIDKPTGRIIAQGTKITWQVLEGTEYDRLKYWYKMKVWATKYDAHCVGCTGRTFSGTEVKQGICATDPKVIPLGTNFYVEGYGLCRAEDIGGAIKGKHIDLGFIDASKAAWGAAYTNVYLLTNAPEQ